MSEPVKLKSKDGRSTCECPEKYAVALVASGKWVRVTENTEPNAALASQQRSHQGD